MIRITINHKNYNVSEDMTILKTCEKVHINIPTLCYDDRLTPGASCNLCIVEIEGENTLSTSCNRKVEEGMKIYTNSNKVIRRRREILNDLARLRPCAFTNNYKTDGGKIHTFSKEYGIAAREEDLNNYKKRPKHHPSPFYYIDPNKCIGCRLCVRVCDDLQGNGYLEMNDKGYVSISSSKDKECEECGNCIDVCPTGAIVPKIFLEEFAKLHEMHPPDIEQSNTKEPKNVKTTCTYCGVGCQMDLVVQDNHVLDIKGVKVEPNNGLLCVKGRFGYKFINHPDRLTTPLIKRNGKFEKATWEEAYDLIVQKAKELKDKYGGEVFGGLTSARCSNEENYLFQKLFRGVFGTNNIDHCARL